jgi:hypothetical protein
VRVVRSPGGTIVIDPSGRAAGRGAYLCRDAACWSATNTRRGIEHALRATLPDDVAATLAGGPDAVGIAAPDMTATGAPSSPDGIAPARTDNDEGGTDGQE